MNYTLKQILKLIIVVALLGSQVYGRSAEIKQFEIRNLNNFVDISWITTSESGNQFFSIERSEDGTSYFPISRVEGKGVSTQESYYDFTDWDPPKGMVYYRLSSTDYEGEISVYPIVIAGICGEVEPSVEIKNQLMAPGEPLSVFFADAPAQAVDLKVLDLYGKVVANQSIQLEHQGARSIVLDCTVNLARGPYVLAFNSELFEAAEPILIQ